MTPYPQKTYEEYDEQEFSQRPISTTQPIDPHEPTLTVDNLGKAIIIEAQYTNMIATLISAGFAVTQKDTKTCFLKNKQGEARIYLMTDKTTNIATAVEIEIIANDHSKQQLFSAEITKNFKENNILLESL